MTARILSLLVGCLFGNILTAVIVVRVFEHKSVFEVGTGNPGMANVMANFGFRDGALVLAGDLLKTILACFIAKAIFPDADKIVVLYAGLGACIGHNWPLTHHFQGGKGVSVTCMAIFLFSPLWGLLADIAGMLVVFSTGFLPLGAFVITWLFAVFAFVFHGVEAGIVAVVLALIMTQRHFPGLMRVLRGQEEPHAKLFAKLGKK